MDNTAEQFILNDMLLQEQRAENLIAGKPLDGSENITIDDLVAIYRWQLSRKLNVGYWSDYFDNLTPTQIKFELHLHLASDPEYQWKKNVAEYQKAVKETPEKMFEQPTEWEDISFSDDDALAKAQQDFQQMKDKK